MSKGTHPRTALGQTAAQMIRRYYLHDVARDSAALTYYLLFAIFPLLIFVSTLLGILELDVDSIVTGLRQIVPGDVAEVVRGYLEYVSGNASRQLMWFSLVFSIWFPMRATGCLLHSLRKAFGKGQPKNILLDQLKIFLFAIWLMVSIGLTLLMITVGRRALYFVSGIITVPDGFINLVARENLTGLRVVRAYNAEDYQEAKFTKANKDLTDTQLFTNRVMAFMMPLMNTIMNGLMLAVYWIGTYLIDAAGLKDKLTVFSNMVVFSNYSVQVIMSFLLMSMVFVLWPRADVSAQRIMEVLDTEPIVENGTKTAADVAKTGQRGTVEFRNVSFTYPDSREAMLEGINFTAEQGQTVAFIGSTGSGKSSLINLVPRFYDTSQGQVLVDGVDVRDYDLKALRDKIGYVPQQSVLFKGTVASNVSYGDQPGDPAEVEMADTSTPAGRKREAALIAAGEAAEGADIPAEQLNRVRAAADVAQASEFVARMDGGYSAAIAQGGSNVSGGQKQRLSIARAVYRHPEILIFDDSFSALDFKTDREVRDALAREAKDSTKLIVAQRIGTIMNADRIVVLDDGKVVGQGTHKELLDNCDVYRQIAESQLSQSELTA